MIITCEQCETSFNLDEGLLKPAGSKVRCSKCKHIFVAYPPISAQDLAETAAGAAETDIAAEGFEETAETGVAQVAGGSAEEEELDLFGLDEPVKPTAEPEETAAAQTDEEELDLSDLDLDLDEKEPLAAEAGEEALDLSGLDEELKLADDSAEGAPGEPSEEDLSLDLDLDLDEKEPAAAEAEEEALDLSGLDDELKLADETEEGAAGELSEEDLSLDLGLDLDKKEPPAGEAGEEELDLSGLDDELKLADEPAAGEAVEPGEEDLSLDLGQVPEVDGKEPAAAEIGEEELDLSDIESMLEEDASEKAAKKKAEDDAGLEVETEEIDLSELEKILDAEGESEPAAAAVEASEDQELELDIDIEPESQIAAMPGEKKAAPETEELDLTDLESDLKLDEAPAVQGGAELSEDLELEFITEEPQEEAFQTDEGTADDNSGEATEEILMMVEEESAPAAEKDEEALEPEQATDEKAAKALRKKAAPPKPKKRVSPLLVVLLVIVLLIGGLVMLPTFGIQIPFVGDAIKNIPVGDYLRNIPYVGDLLGPKTDERGNLKMTSSDINSKFVENTKFGTLFVITGKVRNGYDHPRGFVKVTGRLYAKGKKLSKVQTVFCGNTLTDQELAGSDMTSIGKKLLEPAGQKESNARVPPGMQVPFMLVFSNLPADLEEFDIQIEESLPAS